MKLLDELKIPTTIRQVLIPTKNDTEENFAFLASLVNTHSCVDKVELLPFKKLCTMKYERMGIPFPFAHVREATKNDVALCEQLLCAALSKK